MWSDKTAGKGVSATLRRRQVISFVKKYTLGANLRILDLGCGKGYLSEALARFGSVTGVDLAEETIERNKERFPQLTFVHGDVTDPTLPQNLSRYDLIVSSEVIEHLGIMNREQFLGNAYALLRPQGLFILTTPNRDVFLRLKHPDEEESVFLDRLDEQPINNLMKKKELKALLKSHFDILDFASVQPLVKFRLLDLLWKGLFSPLDYRFVNEFTNFIGIDGKYMIFVVRRK
jgi:2-polyprenyl-3-methyl-5-hydroxy-6-metoxy-1,4-benzoquinol methylase